MLHVFQRMIQYIHMNHEHQDTTGWGVHATDGTEIWDAPPVFAGDSITWKDKAKLLFYPKKFLLYRAIAKDIKKKNVGDLRDPYRILDVGSGTGASVIDMKKLFGRHVDVVGADVMTLQNDIARQNLKKHGVHAEIVEYETALPFEDNSFDAIYTSDVLGHVPDVEAWLGELHRVLVPGGLLAMFSESKLGKHAYMRKFFFRRGMNVDPHAEFHISLYSKDDIQAMLYSAGFSVHSMRAAVAPYALLYPDDVLKAIDNHDTRHVFLRPLFASLAWLKQKTHPFSAAVVELYGFVFLQTVGRVADTQGYVVLAEKIATDLTD